MAWSAARRGHVFSVWTGQSSHLQGLDTVDVHQRDVSDAVGIGIDHDHFVPSDCSQLRMPDLVDLSIGKAHFERLERLAHQPFPDGFGIHKESRDAAMRPDRSRTINYAALSKTKLSVTAAQRIHFELT